MKNWILCAAALLPASVSAQETKSAADAVAVVQDSAPLMVQRQSQSRGNAFLPANTEIVLRMNQDVTTRGDTWDEQDAFDLTVEQDVVLGDYVVIPRGSRGVGRITWLTSRGAFGKSGKMDIELEYIELQGRRIPINGTYRQEGEGNTLATVGGVVVASIFAGFITGKSALIPEGRELTATTEEDIELGIPASEIRRAPSTVAPLAGASATTPLQVTAVAESAVPVDGEAEPAD